MNKTLATFAKALIIDGLRKLPSDSHDLFKLMYGTNNGKRTVEDAKLMSIDAVIAEMPDSKLDWALTQIENSFEK